MIENPKKEEGDIKQKLKKKDKDVKDEINESKYTFTKISKKKNVCNHFIKLL